MCGIVGIIGKQAVAPSIVDALKRLEYRGYDSAGVATLDGNRISRRRAEGKLRNLEDKLSQEPLAGHIGIGHTRWATHGAPTENNAHPHATERLAIVHNGIIENFSELKDELRAAGVSFATETDTEVVAHLLTRELEAGRTPAQAMGTVLRRLDGAFAFAVLFRDNDNLLAAARKGAPLAIGIGDGEMYLGSDAIALAPFTNRVVYLDDGDWALITADQINIFDASGAAVHRDEHQSVASALMVDKGNHRHFMVKEIYEQPEVVGHTLAHYVDFASGTAKLPAGTSVNFADLRRLSLSACGTAYYSGLIAKYWFERLARLPVDIDIGSEFRYREMPLDPGGLALFVSQSGETADTLASLRYCKEQQQRIGAIVNVRESTIARESDIIFPTLAGPEIGVASTKAFTCQLSVLAALAVIAGRQRGVLSSEDERRLVRAFSELPRLCAAALKLEPQIDELARHLAKAEHVLYLGRGTSYPLAMEGALKLKEISYIHAEGYAAGELKHGPIALIDENMPVVFIAPYDHVFDKTVSNIQEVAARGGRIILITDAKGEAAAGLKAEETIIMPEMPATLTPIAYALPMQLLAYHVAIQRGTDVDQPRNLAKSVTVE
mgnify:CR=1 FL=1